MANALLYDCFSGISGDMHIGAMLDVGVPERYLRSGLGNLALASEFELQVERGKKMGIAGTKATVAVRPDAPTPHRRLADVAEIIQAAGYEKGVEARSLAMFQALAEAEASVHGIGVEDVHFHEVGATDAIVDITAAALALEWLNVGRVVCRTVEVGGGTVSCEHGVMPVPAPATAALLRGAPCTYGAVRGEATTPTGAAILKCNVDEFRDAQSFQANRIGYGIGQRDFAIPNALRVMLGEVGDGARPAAYEVETNVEMECNVDDMSPEAFQPLLDSLFAAGAKDVFVAPGLMKKSRPGHRISVLAAENRVGDVAAALMAGSTTLGVRLRDVTKWMLPRETATVRTSVGEVRVKAATLPDGRRKWKPEHDDLLRLARESGQGYLTLRQQVEREISAWMERARGNDGG